MRALVLLSGGLDSTVALWWARAQGWDATVITFHYHKRPPPEVEATRAIAAHAGARIVEVAMPWVHELTDRAHPLHENPRLADLPEGYVPARNALFYAAAAYHAELLGAERIVGGHTGVDPETFPDAGADYFDALGELLRRGLASGTPIEIVQPLLDLDKAGVLRLGIELGAPVERSWSCYNLGPRRCGECPSCVERAEAFKLLGLIDLEVGRA